MKIEDSDFLKHISPYDIIFLSECWFSKTTCSSLELSGFKVYCKARSRKKKAKRDSGGLCVLIKNSINCYFEVLDWENEDGLIFKVDKKNTLLESDLYFVFTYIRPNASTRNDLSNENDPFDVLWQKVAELRNNNELIVIGDLNSRTSTLLISFLLILVILILLIMMFMIITVLTVTFFYKIIFRNQEITKIKKQMILETG